MVDVLENSEVRSGLLSEFAKKKGLSSLDDEDVEPLRELEAQHQLSVHIEHCNCIRPSHHLRGSKEKYVTYFKQIEAAMQFLAGAGEVAVLSNQPEWSGQAPAEPVVASPSARKTRPASAGPASQRTPLQPRAVGDQYGLASAPQGRWPRVGSFEVCYSLINIKSKASYGPFLLFSKLQSERWPAEAKLSARLREHLQVLLKQDEQHYALEKKVRQKIDEKKAEQDSGGGSGGLRTTAPTTPAPAPAASAPETPSPAPAAAAPSPAPEAATPEAPASLERSDTFFATGGRA